MMTFKSNEDVLNYLNSTIAPSKAASFAEQGVPLSIGEATVAEPETVAGHLVWAYGFTGVPVAPNGHETWIIDTGEVVQTSMFGADGLTETVESAYLEKYGRSLGDVPQ